MLYDDAVARVTMALRTPLPGPVAHARMAPRPPRQWPSGFNPAHIRNAAGLVLFVGVEGRAHIILTVRAPTLERHGGQVSLPGGVVDPGETFEQTAIREAHEEISLEPGLIRTLGGLSPVEIPVSGFRLHPIVACASPRPSLHPSDREVARILDVPVETLLDPRSIGAKSVVRDGRTLDIPYFRLADAEIWGATAMVLAECLTLLGWEGMS